jgi:N-acetylmuramoyl-L-alanine amidase CwlA
MTTLPELNLLIEIIAEGRPNRPGTIITPNFLTIHNTDNDDRGAGAKAHSGFVRNTGYYILHGERHYVSWHFSVDDQL